MECECNGMDNKNIGCLIHDQELIDERCLKSTQEELKMLQKLNLTLAYPRNYYVNPYTMNVTLSMVSMPNIILITPFPIVFFYCSN